MSRKIQFKLLYNWAESLFKDEKISASVMHTLKAVISCSFLDRPTIKQINEARTRSLQKFAQDDPVSDKTISRHLKALVESGILGKLTATDGWYSRNTITILALNELVTSPQDIVNPSIPVATSHCSIVIPSHNHKAYSNDYDYVKEEQEMRNINPMAKVMRAVERKLDTPMQPRKPKSGEYGNVMLSNFNPDELAIYDKLLSLGVYKSIALKWVNKHSVAELANLIEASALYGADNRGAYINKSITELVQQKELKPYVPSICYKPWEPGAVMSKSSPGLGLQQIREIKARMQR